MAKQRKYAIHADFLHFPIITFSFNALIVGLINLLLRAERFVRQHRVIRNANKHLITASTGHQIKVLQVNTAPRDQLAPAVIYFHGGAYALTYASTHIYSVEWYARNADCTVFLVDYRLSPRHPFPAGFEDCCSVLQWVTEHAAELGIDNRRIVLMGDSAGGGLAASVSQWAHDQYHQQEATAPQPSATTQLAATASCAPAVSAQVLIYPTLDKSCSTPSALQFYDVPLWNAISNRAMWSSYLRDTIGKGVPAYAAAADRDSLKGLPQAYIETAEFDPLRDEGIAYANRLSRDGVNTQLNETSQTIHGFDTVFSSAITQQSLHQRCQFLRSVFYPDQAEEPSTPSTSKHSTPALETQTSE